MNVVFHTFYVALLVAVGVVILMTPLLRYLDLGWQQKRYDIMDGFNVEARATYFRMFFRSTEADRENMCPAKISLEFEALYARSYGRALFMFPAFLLFLVGILISSLIVFAGLQRMEFAVSPLFLLPNTALAALSGAYLWVVNDHISRGRRLDFAPSDVLWGVLRLVIAIPMGYAFASIASPSLGPFVAFALGAFPLEGLMSKMRQIADTKLGMAAPVTEAGDDIIRLQGVNRSIVDRLNNEDITTVTQVAYCDPLRLVMRSNLNFNFVSDCMNQALAWLYLRDDLDKIRPLGLRGAVEIRHLMDDIDNVDPHAVDDHQRAVAAFPMIAKAVNQDPATLQITFRNISADPYTAFLYTIWT